MNDVQAFAKEFAEKRKGRRLHAERLGGSCLLLKRQVLTKIVVELEPWTDLSLFDTDILSTKARQVGFALECARDCFVHHFGMRTFAHGAAAVNKAEARARYFQQLSCTSGQIRPRQNKVAGPICLFTVP